ncbi:MAG: 30S ribosome-binding factor RbfA [Rhodothermaceae bacterium]
MSIRQEKVQKMIKEELSLIFLNRMKDPAFSLVTITGVKVTPDLKIAKVFVSMLEKERRDSVLKKLNSLKKMIRTALAQRINLKFAPELLFYVDETADYVDKMEELFRQINENDNNGSE